MRTSPFLAIAAAGAIACQTTGGGAQGPRTAEVRRDAPVSTAHPYEMDGVVKSVGGGFLGMSRTVTIARREAPDVSLHVARGTRVTLDDRPAQVADLREGDQVRAVFDFSDSSPVAIDIVVRKKAR